MRPNLKEVEDSRWFAVSYKFGQKVAETEITEMEDYDLMELLRKQRNRGREVEFEIR